MNRNKKVLIRKVSYGLMSGAMVATTLAGVLSTGDLMVSASTFQVVKGTVDMKQGGSATITIKGNKGQSMVNKKFELFKIFDAENATHNESINYTFNPAYKEAVQTVVAKRLNKRDNTNLVPSEVTEYMAIDYIQTLNNFYVEGAHTEQHLESRYADFRYFTEELRDEIKRRKLTGDVIEVHSVGKENQIVLDNLKYGYYFIDEISFRDEEGADNYANSLIMVDTANPDSEIQIKSDYPHIIKKIQEDDHKDVIKDDGYNDIGDYEIGQTVPYRFESTIPDMNGYHEYYYAWHDVMDKALTFHNNKDEISIVITQGKKSYTLKENEYNVITDKKKLPAGDTFKIEIPDIKAIVDDHIAEPDTDNDGHYLYDGTTVTLKYNATLNDVAAQNLGRPGYENDVRLEFSNDADVAGEGSTGFTPWDTVVCFSYGLNGLKTNDHDTVLKDAHFRLYSDKECKNEVFLKRYDPMATANLNTEGTESEALDEESVENEADVVVDESEIVPDEALEVVKEETSSEKTSNGVSDEGTQENVAEVTSDEANTYAQKPGIMDKDDTTTNNVTNPDPSEKGFIGNNAYVVINRDSVGGTDHIGGTQPQEAIEMVSDDQGNFTILGLDEGTYYIKETKAPAGYRPLLDPIKLEVKPTYTADRNEYIKGTGSGTEVLKKLEATAHIKEFYDGRFKDGDANLNTNVDKGDMDIKIINEVGSKLPVTGSTAMLLLVGAGVLLVGGSVVIAKKSKSKKGSSDEQ